MSDSSFSPSSHSEKDESRSFLHYREHDGSEEEASHNSEFKEVSHKYLEDEIQSPKRSQSPERLINNEASPPGSPRPRNIAKKPEIETFKYLYNSTGNVENSSRRSSLSRPGIKEEKEVQSVSPPHRQEYNDKTCTEETSCSLPCIKTAVVIVILAVLIALAYNFVGFGKVSSPTKMDEDKSEVMFTVDWMKFKTNSFMNQVEKFWMVIGSATISVIKQAEPRDPAVILLVVPKSAILTSTCFIDKYVAFVTGLFNQQETDIVRLNSRDYKDLDADNVKLKIDLELEKGFRSGRKVAVIGHLESLAAEAAMIFYRFCDNDQAPFKRVVILFTLHVTDEEFSLAKDSDRFVEKKLAELWEPTIGKDKFQPLMSRIANSNVFVRPENSKVLAEINC